MEPRRPPRRGQDLQSHDRSRDLKTLAPDFPWDAFLAETACAADDRAMASAMSIVAEKTAFAPLAKIFADTPVSTWRDYLTVHYLHALCAPICPSASTTAISPSTARCWAGSTQQLDRTTRGIHLLDGQLGEALGKLYVARYFPPEAKAKADQLVANLLKAYEADIQTLTWMSPATRAKALEKISQFTPKIGYPSHWRDYSAYDGRARRSDRRHPARRGVRMEPRAQSHQPAGGQDRMGHDAAHHQRLLQSLLQRDRVSRPPSCSRPSSIPMPTMR